VPVSAAPLVQSRGCSAFPTVITATAVADITTAITAFIAIGESTAVIPGSCFARPGMTAQFFSRYPVRKIHQITTRQITRNASVMPMLTATLTSAIS
jgi:hypothetical protein